MNTKQLFASALVAALAGTAGSVAFADEAALQYVDIPVASKVQRAEVKNEYLRARAAGEMVQGEVAAAAIPANKTGVTRAEVRAEVISARNTLAQPIEVTMFASTAPQASQRSREEVRAEARAHARTTRAIGDTLIQ